jgi:hypothetical protein
VVKGNVGTWHPPISGKSGKILPRKDTILSEVRITILKNNKLLNGQGSGASQKYFFLTHENQSIKN